MPLGASPAATHLWTDQDGRRYDAAILSTYNGEVTFQRPDGRTFTLAQNDLVPSDQMLVREWIDKQPVGQGIKPPPTAKLSSFGRSFVIDEPRVLRLRSLPGKGYPNTYLGIPLTLRNKDAGPVEYVNVYFYNSDHTRRIFPLVPPGSTLMVQDGETTAFLPTSEVQLGRTYVVLLPLQDPTVRVAAYAVAVVGNSAQTVATVFPSGSWREFDFPEKSLVARDKYADYSGQELYTNQAPADLFSLPEVVRLRPRTGEATPDRDYFRLSLGVKAPFPASALQAQWYAFDKDHKLIHAVGEPPYATPNRKDSFYVIQLAGHGPAELNDAVPPTQGEAWDLLQLPDAAWWDRPEVDSIVFVFGTETKKVAKVFSKSGATLADLPVPEKDALGDAKPAILAQIPVREY
jgi:hypothetical protein